MLEEKINQFFADYEARFNKALNGEALDVKGIRNSFAHHFIEASPTGINNACNNFLFKLSIPKGFKYYKKLNMRAIKIASKEVIPVDAFHFLVKVNWTSWYMKKYDTSETIDFTVHYLLQHLNNELKIFAYITGEERKTLKERGLIP